MATTASSSGATNTAKEEEPNVIREILFRVSRAMLQHPHVRQFEDSPHLLYTALQGFFEMWAERQELAQQCKVTPQDASAIVSFCASHIITAWQGTDLHAVDSIVAFIQRSPLVSLDVLRKGMQSKLGGASRQPAFLGAALPEVIEMCRALDSAFQLKTPLGAVHVLQFTSIVVTLVPVEKLGELFLFLGETLEKECMAQCHDNVMAYWILASIAKEWSVVDSRHRAALAHLSSSISDEITKTPDAAARQPLGELLETLFSEDSILRGLAQGAADPIAAAEPLPALASASTSRRASAVRPPSAESLPPPSLAQQQRGDRAPETESGSGEEDASAEGDGVDYDFWNQLAN